MTRSTNNPWLRRFAGLTAVLTLGLIGIGGLVTSHEAGLSVPDWPTSFGYNMFLLPIHRWWHVGNVFYEHSHRLFASAVGLLTTILAIWLWVKESRVWLRWLGVIAFFAVVLQGVLGGLRVVWLKDQIGIFHATLAQLFFVLTCAIALFTSKWWTRAPVPTTGDGSRDSSSGVDGLESTSKWHWLLVATTAAVLLQLILGATMRHQHAGLSIPDFPLAYGRLWPATDPESVLRYNQQRIETTAVNPITAFQIELQMAHRLLALLILAGVAASAWMAFRRFPRRDPQVKLATLWAGLIVAQIGLGAATVLSHKAADVATAHVLVGALSLAAGVLLCLVSFRNTAGAPAALASPASSRREPPSTFSSKPAVAPQ